MRSNGAFYDQASPKSFWNYFLDKINAQGDFEQFFVAKQEILISRK